MKATERSFDGAKLLGTIEGHRLLELLTDGLAALTGVLAIVTEQTAAKAAPPMQ